MTKSNTMWTDIISLGFTLSMLALVAGWAMQGDFMTNVVSRSMTWQLIRSTGISAYILFTLSTMWGLALSSKVVKEWSPGSLSMLLHTSVSWLGIALAGVHAVLLLFDEYVSYQLNEILVPFRGEYRPFAVGLGIIAFWLLLLVAISFNFKKQLGHKNWKRLHYVSYAGFFLITAHAYMAGADADKLGFQGLLGLTVAIIIILTGYRIGASPKTRKERS